MILYNYIIAILLNNNKLYIKNFNILIYNKLLYIRNLSIILHIYILEEKSPLRRILIEHNSIYTLNTP